jgi:dihydroflavonol-4-reductase
LLLEKGYQVRALIFKKSEGLSDEIEVVNGDITVKEDVDKLIAGCDAVIHMAAKISIEKDRDGSVNKINKQGTGNVVEACLRHKVKRLVHFSSIHTFDPFPLDEELNEKRPWVKDGSDYDKSKIAGEKMVLNALAAGLETVIICPTSVFGPRDFQPSLLGGAIVDIFNRKVPALIPGGYDFVDVRDVAQGTLLALEKGKSGEKYLLGGEFLTVQELAQKVGKIGNVKVTNFVLSIGFLKLMLPFFKLQSVLTGKPAIFTKESLKALSESNPNVSSRKAEKDLGYTKTEIDKSIKDTLIWFGKHGKIQFS